MISGNNVVRHGTEDTTDGSIVNDTFKRIVNTHDVKGRDKYTNGKSVGPSFGTCMPPPPRHHSRRHCRRDKDNTTDATGVRGRQPTMTE